MIASMRDLFVFALVATVTAGPASLALAQDVKTIDTFKDWTAYTYEERGSTVCYMASQPTKEEGNYSVRGEVYAIVSHRPDENASNVVSFMAGYPFKEKSEVTVVIDGRSRFTLFTHEENAWAYDEDDSRLVAAMRSGSRMVVKGTSQRGTLTTDTYSLMGFTNAHRAISSACGQ